MKGHHASSIDPAEHRDLRLLLVQKDLHGPLGVLEHLVMKEPHDHLEHHACKENHEAWGSHEGLEPHEGLEHHEELEHHDLVEYHELHQLDPLYLEYHVLLVPLAVQGHPYLGKRFAGQCLQDSLMAVLLH